MSKINRSGAGAKQGQVRWRCRVEIHLLLVLQLDVIAFLSQDSVANLVKSIRKHKKFKQLASYSVKCLEKVGIATSLLTKRRCDELMS
jgi:3-deoxy-D-manno-octulosonate 8-phosphate phosphatase KdsC-like HAD superfamily phosphatase